MPGAFTYLSNCVYYGGKAVPAGGPEEREMHICSQF